MTKLFSLAALFVALFVLASSNARAGLLESVYETPNAQGGHGLVPGVANQPANNDPTDAYITQLQASLAHVAPTYTYINNATTFNYYGNGDADSVSTYLHADGPGAAGNTGSADGTQNYNVVYDANGLISVSTTGLYTFTVNNADDAVRVYVGGSHQVGQTGSLVAEQNYQGNIGPASTTVTLTAGHAYPFEVFTYQGYGGANLNLSITGPGSVTLTPEPSSVILCGLGAIQGNRMCFSVQTRGECGLAPARSSRPSGVCHAGSL